jgi:hypothetical protein
MKKVIDTFPPICFHFYALTPIVTSQERKCLVVSPRTESNRKTEEDDDTSALKSQPPHTDLGIHIWGYN